MTALEADHAALVEAIAARDPELIEHCAARMHMTLGALKASGPPDRETLAQGERLRGSIERTRMQINLIGDALRQRHDRLAALLGQDVLIAYPAR